MSRPVEDLDGDGLSDVVGFTVTAEGGVDLTCRRGTNGSVIARVPTEDGVIWHPVDAGWHAMLLVTRETDAANVRLTVRWVERCAVRWTRTFEGSDTPATDASEGTPHFRMTLDAGTGRAAVLLERVSDRTTVSPKVSSSVAVVVSGENGETIFESDPADFVDEFPTMIPLPDVTGDGLGDYGYSVEVFPGSALGGESRLDAYSTEDGAPVWSIESPGDPGAYAFPVLDTTGDGITELVLSSLDRDESTTTYVDGAKGDVLWRNPVGRPYLLRDGAEQLLGLAGIVEEDGTYWVVVSAVRPADGNARYTVRRALGPSAGASVSFRDDKLGDVDGDGVLDGVFRAVASYGEDTERVRHVVVSGRTGTAVDRDVLALLPNGWPFGTGSFDGTGDDAWASASNTVVAGDDGTALARWTGPGPVAQLLAMRIDGDACTDLLVATGDGPDTSRLYAVSGATGEVVWAVPSVPEGTRVLDRTAHRCAAAPTARPTSSPRPLPIPATGGPPAWPAAALGAVALLAIRLRRVVVPRSDLDDLGRATLSRK